MRKIKRPIYENGNNQIGDLEIEKLGFYLDHLDDTTPKFPPINHQIPWMTTLAVVLICSIILFVIYRTWSKIKRFCGVTVVKTVPTYEIEDTDVDTNAKPKDVKYFA